MHEKRDAPDGEYPLARTRRKKTPSWYKPDFKIKDGKIRVPDAPGMGLEIDPDYLKQATVIARLDKAVPGGGTGSGSGS